MTNSDVENMNEDLVSANVEVLALEYRVHQAKKRETEAKRCLKVQQRRLDESMAHIIAKSHKIMTLRAKLRRKYELITNNLEDFKMINSTLRRNHLIENICTIEGDLKRAQALMDRGTQRILAVSNDINKTIQRELDNINTGITEADRKASSLGEKLLQMKMISSEHLTRNAASACTYEGALHIIFGVMTRQLKKKLARANVREKSAKTRASALESEAREIRDQTERYGDRWNELTRQQLEIRFRKTHLKICYVNFGAL